MKSNSIFVKEAFKNKELHTSQILLKYNEDVRKCNIYSIAL